MAAVSRKYGSRLFSTAGPALARLPKYGQYFIPKVEESVNFQVGQPAPSMLPLDLIRKCATEKFSETDPLLLQYGYISGYPGFRKSLASFLTEGYGYEVTPEHVFATTGVTGGLSLTCSLIIDRDDLVFAEEPSYFLALSIFKDFGLNVTQIPMEQDGVDLDILEKKLKAGQIPKFFYTIPTAHNPTGRTMSAEKRERLCELSRTYGFKILADEVYHLLTFPDVCPPPAMCHFDADGTDGTVMSMGSFSKILAPALRMGWIQSGMNPVMSSIVHEAIDSGAQRDHLAWTRNTLWQHAKVLMEALDKSLPSGCSYEVPDGGYFILVKLPESIKAVDVLEAGKEIHKVQFLPGASFGDAMGNYLRLSFSYYDADDLAIGAQRVGDAVKSVLNSKK
eukprot:GSMAST32.ASY1.ANO1.2801.1 assembled CDS